MPVLRLDLSDPFAFPRLFALMLHPQNEGRREEFFAFAQEQAPLPEDVPKYRMLDVARKAYLYDGRPMTGGMLAGVAFYRSLQAAAHHREHQGIERAFFVVSEATKFSRETVRKAWTSHKSVSHLWAVRFVKPEIFDPEGLSRFIGFAEHLRILGLSLDRGGVLNDHDPWEVQSEPAPPTFEIEIAPLPKQALTALPNFSPRGRYN
jgi:hypothetical protein